LEELIINLRLRAKILVHWGTSRLLLLLSLSLWQYLSRGWILPAPS